MKNVFFLLLAVSTSGCLGRRPSPITGQEGKILPSFNFIVIDKNKLLNTNTIDTGTPIVFFYFQPNCPYCRAQTLEVTNNIKSLKNIRFYFISKFPLINIKDYWSHYELKKYPNIITGRDYEGYFEKYLNVNAVPCLAIYNKRKKLKKVLIGEVSTKEIENIAFE
jgi:hypothetical protein